MLQRLYKMMDMLMIQFAKNYRALFLEYQTDFTDEDADFGGTFPDDWDTAIQASESAGTAETRDDVLQQETADVEAQMTAGRKKYNQAKYYIKKAFRNKPKVQNEFGLDDYNQVRASQPGMILFLKKLYNLSENKYKTELLAAGYTEAKITEIDTIKKALDTQNIEQDLFAAKEPVDTEARIKKHNTTWGFVQKVNDLSKVIYYDPDNVVKLNLFLLPRSEEPDQDIFNLVGTASDSATAAPLPDVNCIIESLNIFRTTDSNGQYGYGNLPPGTYTVKFVKEGYVMQELQVTVPASGQVVLDVQLVAE